jgi:hypothetical protein
VRVVYLFAALAAIPSLADERTQRLLARLAEEASAFEQTAPSLISVETLKQNALKIGRASRRGTDEWQRREIRSEYVFASMGNPRGIREIRKVIAVDGKPVTSSNRSLDHLYQSVQAKDDRSRKKLLEEFEKHGLIGTVTDFGQLLLLFTQANQDSYEFTFAGTRFAGAEQCLAFAYGQHDGPGALTVWDSEGQRHPAIKGEVWVTSSGYRPLRITLVSTRTERSGTVREEAQVEYVMSSHGVLVPASVTHRQYREAKLTAENIFTYAPFRRFGASTTVRFSTP